jgi:ABC-type transporter Mla MlaB component
LAERAPAFRCDVSGLDEIDIGTVDALARIALRLRREGCELRLRGATAELRNLIALAGLAEVLTCEDAVSRDAAAARTAGRTGRCRERT